MYAADGSTLPLMRSPIADCSKLYVDMPIEPGSRFTNAQEEELLLDFGFDANNNNNYTSNRFHWLQDFMFGDAVEVPELSLIDELESSQCEDDWKSFNLGFPLFDDPMLDGQLLRLPEINDPTCRPAVRDAAGLRAFDVASILEKFDAFEDVARPTEECFDTADTEENSLATEISVIGHQSMIPDDSKTDRSMTSPDETPSPPRFSIRLRWNSLEEEEDDDVVDTSSSTTQSPILQKHDYSSCCNSSPVSPVADVPVSPLPQQQQQQLNHHHHQSKVDVFAGRHMRSVLKSTRSKVNQSTEAKEILYSKLPDYYTVLAPVESAATSSEEECFDKLPSYITGLQGIISRVLTSATKCDDEDQRSASPLDAVFESDIVTYDNNGKSMEDTDTVFLRRSPASMSMAAEGSTRRRHKSRYPSSRSPSSCSRSSSSSSTASNLSSLSNDSYSDVQCTEKRARRLSDGDRAKLLEGNWQRDGDVYNTVEVYDDDVDEKRKYIEDRRVVHVGNIASGTTRCEIRRRFGIFGPIQKITLHRRRYGDCYAFITFLYKGDAFEALEHGNDDAGLPRYELSLGGRRMFCLENYSDLDATAGGRDASARKSLTSALDFDALLNAAKSQLMKSSS